MHRTQPSPSSPAVFANPMSSNQNRQFDSIPILAPTAAGLRYWDRMAARSVRWPHASSPETKACINTSPSDRRAVRHIRRSDKVQPQGRSTNPRGPSILGQDGCAICPVAARQFAGNKACINTSPSDRRAVRHIRRSNKVQPQGRPTNPRGQNVGVDPRPHSRRSSILGQDGCAVCPVAARQFAGNERAHQHEPVRQTSGAPHQAFK
jgi:hypothetical protein